MCHIICFTESSWNASLKNVWKRIVTIKNTLTNYSSQQTQDCGKAEEENQDIVFVCVARYLAFLVVFLVYKKCSQEFTKIFGTCLRKHSTCCGNKITPADVLLTSSPTCWWWLDSPWDTSATWSLERCIFSAIMIKQSFTIWIKMQDSPEFFVEINCSELTKDCIFLIKHSAGLFHYNSTGPSTQFFIFVSCSVTLESVVA